MSPRDLRLHIESHQDGSFWFGSFVEFARANSLTAGEMYDILAQLESTGSVSVKGCTSTCYTLRRAIRPSARPMRPHARRPGEVYRHCARHAPRHLHPRSFSLRPPTFQPE